MGEPPLVRPEAMTALDWLREAKGFRTIAKVTLLERGAARLREAAGASGIDAASSEALRLGAGALWIEAAKARALAGETDAALAAIREGGEAALMSKRAIALARSSARYLAGDVEAALAELDAEGVDAGGTAVGALETRVLAALRIQRAELLAARGGSSPAPEVVARAALEADAVAAGAGDAVIDVRARWTRLALVRPPTGAPLRPETHVDLAAVNPARRWPWVGEVQTSTTAVDSPGAASSGESSLGKRWEGPLSRSLAMWSAAVTASAPDRLALRYEILSVRGDAMTAPAAELSLAGELLTGKSDVEVWLDAFLARSTRELSHRTYAFARWQAATWRGDKERAAAWWKRYEALAAIASDPELAEIAAFLGI
jgi:hypothetical protein